MNRFLFAFVVVSLTLGAGCNRARMVGLSASRPTGQTLAQARKGFKTNIVRKASAEQPVPEPPLSVLRLVRYPSARRTPSASRQLAAYVTPNAGGARKRPAILWITGGDCNTIDEGIWQDAPPQNDQTARAFRDAGIVTMYPSLRGGSDNPGYREGFYGEVDDVLAAARWLAKQPGVDPKRIYLGGHSTGGTLALLVSEMSPVFRAVLAFGPVEDVSGYGEEYVPVNLSDRKEIELRSPGLWLHGIKSPTFVIEGKDGNIDSLRAMARSSTNPKVFFYALNGDHFNLLSPMNRLIAGKIAAHQGQEPLALTPADLERRIR